MSDGSNHGPGPVLRGDCQARPMLGQVMVTQNQVMSMYNDERTMHRPITFLPLSIYERSIVFRLSKY